MNEKDTDFSSVFTYFCQKVPELGMVEHILDYHAFRLNHGNWIFFSRIKNIMDKI